MPGVVVAVLAEVTPMPGVFCFTGGGTVGVPKKLVRLGLTLGCSFEALVVFDELDILDGDLPALGFWFGVCWGLLGGLFLGGCGCCVDGAC